MQSAEALRLLKTLGLRPKRTVRAVLFMNEENGLGGGRAYHAQHAASMQDHVLALESDSGVFTPRGFKTDANPQAFATLQAVCDLLTPFGAGELHTTGSGGADISPMKADGVITVGLFPDPQRYFDVHHSPADTLDKVSPRELSLGAAAIAGLAWLVADLPEPLPRAETTDE